MRVDRVDSISGRGNGNVYSMGGSNTGLVKMSAGIELTQCPNTKNGWWFGT